MPCTHASARNRTMDANSATCMHAMHERNSDQVNAIALVRTPFNAAEQAKTFPSAAASHCHALLGPAAQSLISDMPSISDMLRPRVRVHPPASCPLNPARRTDPLPTSPRLPSPSRRFSTVNCARNASGVSMSERRAVRLRALPMRRRAPVAAWPGQAGTSAPGASCA